MAPHRTRSAQPETYTVAEATRVSRLSRHMVNYLCRYDVVTPSATRGDPKRGRVRRYTYCDLIMLRVVAKLLDQGISILRFRKQCCLLKNRNMDVRQLLGRKYLVTDGAHVYLKDSRDTVLERIDSGQTAFAFVLDLDPIRSDVADSLKRKKRAA